MTDLGGRSTTLKALGQFRVGNDIGPVSIENHTLIVNGKPFMPVTVNFFPLRNESVSQPEEVFRESRKAVRADIDYLADHGLTGLKVHQLSEEVRTQLRERGMTYMFTGVGSGSPEVAILWAQNGGPVEGATETTVKITARWPDTQIRANRGARAFLITSKVVRDISDRVLELTEKRPENPQALRKYTVKVDTSGLTGKLIVAVRYECLMIGTFTGIEYPLTTVYHGIDNASRAIPDVRGLGPHIIHVFPNEGNFSAYNALDQFSDDPHWKWEWDQWLESRYRVIASLNDKWGTHYTSFDQIPAVFTHQQHVDPHMNPNLALLQPTVGVDAHGEWILADASEFNTYMLQWIYARTVMRVKKTFGNVVAYANTIVTNYNDDQWQRSIDLWRWSESGLDGIGLDLYGGIKPLQRSEVANLLDASDHAGGLWNFIAEIPAESAEDVAAKVKFYWSLGLRGILFQHWTVDHITIKGHENQQEMVEMMGQMQRYVDDRAADYVSFTPRKVMTYATHRPSRANKYIYGGYTFNWSPVREGLAVHDWLERVVKWYSVPEGLSYRTGQYEVALLSAERQWLIDPDTMPHPSRAIITAGMANVDAAAGPVDDDWDEHSILTPDGVELGKTLWSYRATVPPGARILAKSETGAPLAWVDERGRVPRVHLAFYPRNSKNGSRAVDPMKEHLVQPGSIKPGGTAGGDPIMQLLQPWLPQDLIILDDWSVVERDANYISLYAPTAQRFIIDTTNWDITDLNTGQMLPRSRTAEIVLPAEGHTLLKKVPRIKNASEPLVIVKPAGK
jgi:hypothetical protein